MKPLYLIFLAAGLSACDPAPPAASPTTNPVATPAAGGIAVIDLEAAAKRLGRDQVITQELKDAGNAMGEQLAETQKGYLAEYERFKRSLGLKPSEADTQKLAELGRNLNQQFQLKQQEAQQDLAAKRLALVNRFREETKPLAMKIASGKGLNIVLVKSDAVVLGYEPGLDITDDVVAELSRSAPEAPAPAASASPSPAAN